MAMRDVMEQVTASVRISGVMMVLKPVRTVREAAYIREKPVRFVKGLALWIVSSVIIRV